MTAGLAVDHFLPLAGLSRFEKQQLKTAFGLVRDLQTALATRYHF